MAVLFAAGSACFLVGPLPPFSAAVGAQTDAVVFFVGSLLFTAAATLQLWGSSRPVRAPSIDWWSSAIQLLGTLFFNATTARALAVTIDSPSYDRLVWRPDALGSVCFLASGALAYRSVAGGLMRRPPRSRGGAIAAVNLVGCVAFAVSALTAYVLPESGSEVNVNIANVTTALGALGFLVGALLTLPGEDAPRPPLGRDGAGDADHV